MTQSTPNLRPPGGNGLPLGTLRALPDGSLTRAEVRILCDEIERLRAALERIAQEPAPGYTLSCRNIALQALAHPGRGGEGR